MTERRAGAEAARLLEAAQEWLRASAPHLAPTGPDGAACSCPLCQGIAKVREADPETLARWVDGAVAAVEQVSARAAARMSPQAGTDDDSETADDAAAPEPSRGVRRIPLDDDPDARPPRSSEG